MALLDVRPVLMQLSICGAQRLRQLREAKAALRRRSAESDPHRHGLPLVRNIRTKLLDASDPTSGTIHRGFKFRCPQPVLAARLQLSPTIPTEGFGTRTPRKPAMAFSTVPSDRIRFTNSSTVGNHRSSIGVHHGGLALSATVAVYERPHPTHVETTLPRIGRLARAPALS
jgi:hypothetical protein